MKLGPSLASAFALLTCSSLAAALQQPDGTTIPVGPSLQTLFDGRGEAVNALANAATTPETFIPSCSLTFEVIQRNAGYSNSFGWYNVTGTKPTAADLHEFLACNDPVGTIKVLDIKNDPAWAGGEVAFYQAAGPGCPTPNSNQNLFFSQKGYNPDGNQANPFVHLLIYDSTVTPQGFYFAWEDLLAGGDNDFDDLTTFVTGITCSGGGTPCDTGLQGVCAQGLMQCQAGVLTCVQTIQPQTEACDGFDNDCNDVIDEGDLCAVGEVCDKGHCVPECGSGEFQCPQGKVCDADGFCVDPACVNVTCPAGQKCEAGQCVGPCDGVVCPFGQSCQLGVCVDPCGPIACDADQVCVEGVCVDKCPCRDCDAGDVCLPSGSCVAANCQAVTCPAGQHCDASNGQCVDDCMGAVCPSGEVCVDGLCVEDTSGTGGAGTGGSGFGTGAGPASGGGSSTGGAPANGGNSATGGAGGGAGSDDGSGCDCRSAGGTLPSGEGATLALLGGAALLLRRRRQAVRA